MKAHYRPATPEDVMHVAWNLRDADRRELEANGWRNPLKCLEMGWQLSDPCYVMVGRYGLPFGLFGAIPDPDHATEASVWMMATDGLTHEALAFARHSRKIVAGWGDKYTLMHNAVDARNTVHVKWLKWLGFTFLNTVTRNNVPFHEFVKVNTHV